MSWKKEIKTNEKSISAFLVGILDPIMLYFGRYTSMIAFERRMHLQDWHEAIWS